MSINYVKIGAGEAVKRHICILCETWESGGIEGFLHNLLLHMDRCDLMIDIVVAKLKKSIFTQSLEQAGIRFIELSGRSLHQKHKHFRHLLRVERYDVLHLNAFQGMTLYYAKIAQDEGVPIRILHSHNTALRKSHTRIIKLAVHKFFCAAYAKCGTDFWACSKAAAAFMFSSRFPYRFIPNGIDLSRFQRNATVREKLRAQLGIENQIVIGNVGRLCYQKNQFFLLDVLHALRQKRADCTLLLVGDGEDLCALKTRAAQLGICEHVIFFGVTSHVETLLWAMDVFAFPSHFEGFGIAVIEAVAAGLPVVCSEHIPEEAASFPTVTRLPLHTGSQAWADCLLSASSRGISYDIRPLQTAGFDVSQLAYDIRNHYIKTRDADERSEHIGDYSCL